MGVRADNATFNQDLNCPVESTAAGAASAGVDEFLDCVLLVLEEVTEGLDQETLDCLATGAELCAPGCVEAPTLCSICVTGVILCCGAIAGGELIGDLAGAVIGCAPLL